MFIVAIPSFAGSYTSVDTWSLQSMYSISPTANGVTFERVSDYTSVINTSTTEYKVPLLYKAPSTWIAGQTYQLKFHIYSTSVDGIILCLSDSQALNSGTQDYITGRDGLIPSSNKDYSYSFVYNGQPYFLVSLIMSARSKVQFGDFTLFAYNANAELESQNQEIIEQNSELNSKLFDDGETYSFPEVDLSEQYSLFDENKNDLLENGGLITQQNRLVNGVKAFATMFTSVYSLFTEFEVTQFIPFLMYLSVICSLILLILGFVRSRGDKK